MKITKALRDTLISSAILQSKKAYAPYSKYKVGCALLCKDAEIIEGCNVENASYPVGICGEVCTLGAAIAAGKKEFVAIAIATRDMGSPCGSCRQFMYEFAQDLVIFLCDFKGEFRRTNISKLLPQAYAFPKT